MLHGGGAGYESGLPVNKIEAFLPSLIPDLILWIKANKTYLKEERIKSYIDKQSYFIKEKLEEQFKLVLNSSVITEIMSDTPSTPNSLIPLNLDESLATIFPTLRVVPNELDAINISNYKDPISGKRRVLQLVTSNPVTIKDSVPYSISHGISISQNNITGQIIISSDFVENPMADLTANPTDMPSIHPNNDMFAADVEPTGEISELIMYSRALNQEENSRLEGYLAYKQNTQYALPVGHPYLPNTLNEGIFEKIVDELKNLDNSIHSLNAKLDIALNDNKNERGQLHEKGAAYKTILSKTLQDIIGIIGTLSKGFLYARKIKSPTLETVYKSINEREMYPSKSMSDETLNEIIAEYKARVKSADDYLQMLTRGFTKVQSGGSLAVTSQISDHLLFVQQSEESNKLYQPLIIRKQQIVSNGINAYNSLQAKFKDELLSYNDTFSHQLSDIETKVSTLTTEMEPLKTSILSGNWLTYLPNIDTSNTKIKAYGEEIISYKDVSINAIYTQYIYVNQQLIYGDYAFIQNEFKEMEIILNSIKTASLNPVFRSTYMEYLDRLLQKADKFYKEFDKIHAPLLNCLTNIQSFITIAKETGEVSGTTNPINTPINTLESSLEKTVYLRKVVPIDSSLLGLDYVETTADGYLSNTRAIPFYPEFIGYKFTNGTYVKQTNYRTNDGLKISQVYKILPQFTESVYKGLNDNTILNNYSVDSLFEIDREKANSVHCIIASNVPPILLPKPLVKNAWYLIYNLGSSPFCVQQDETNIDMIGPYNGILYIYTGDNNDENNDNNNDTTAPFGTYLWTANMLPYDTILNIPRTTLSMYIDEIGTSIYIRQVGANNYEPLYTADGYFVEVVKADDGAVYDYDDVYRSNPYRVNSVSPDKRTSLLFNPNSKKMVKILPQTFSIVQDSNTGFATLLGTNGIPGVNEYGYAKFIKTPIQYINNNCKIQGAYGDIILKPTGTQFSVPYKAEPFLKFETLFRSRFVASNSIKTVFITNTLNPIVDPNGIGIEVPQINDGAIPFYTDNSVDYEIILMNPIQINIGSGLYPYKVYQDNSGSYRLKIQFINAKAYIQKQIDNVNNYKTPLKAFGKEAIDACTSVQDKYRPFLLTLEQNNSVFETNQGISIEALENVSKSINTTLNKFLVALKEGSEILESYRRAIDEIKVVNDRINYWSKDGSDKLTTMITQINLNVQVSTTKFGTTSGSEFTQIIQECLDNQTKFNDALKTCMNYVMTPPPYVSEVHSWCTFIRPTIDEIEMSYDNVEGILNVKVPTLVKKYETEQIYGGLSSNIQSILGQIQIRISELRDKKIALETYAQLSAGKMTPEATQIIQQTIAKMDSQIVNNDSQYTKYYKEVKTGIASQELLNSLQKFQATLNLQAKEN